MARTGTEPITTSETYIDSRDVIARIEWLEAETNRDAMASSSEADPELVYELAALIELRDEADGVGDWQHGATLIREDQFKEYAQELAEDIGAISSDARWPLHCIDWDRAADELRVDYTEVEFDGETYLVRS